MAMDRYGYGWNNWRLLAIFKQDFLSCRENDYADIPRLFIKKYPSLRIA